MMATATGVVSRGPLDASLIVLPRSSSVESCAVGSLAAAEAGACGAAWSSNR